MRRCKKKIEDTGGEMKTLRANVKSISKKKIRHKKDI